MTKKQKKSPFFVLTGLVIGVLIGLLLGWRIAPVKYFDITPASLHEDFKQEYFILTARAYHADGDPGRAYVRLNQMMDPVDFTVLRDRLVLAEQNPNHSADYNILRKFVNDLERYIEGGQNPSPQPTSDETANG